MSPHVIEFAFTVGCTRAVIASEAGRGPGPQVAAAPDIDRCIVISDARVAELHLDGLRESLRESRVPVESLIVPPGDEHKSLGEAVRMYGRLAELNADRRTALLAVGGGMVGDLAGFVAGTWMRGIPWINCPTTLLAMVDSCLGGKVGVNGPTGKNTIGVFHHPRLIWIDVALLGTLPQRTYRAGLAESIKHAVALDAGFLDWHESHVEGILAQDADTLRVLIERNLRCKARVVAEDERETASLTSDDSIVGRAALNLGHTIGHALEAASGYAWPHGECVALGLVAEMDLAVTIGWLAGTDRDRVETLLFRLGLPIRAPSPFDMHDVIRRMKSDKKARHSRPRFVLPRKLGGVGWCDAVQSEQVFSSLARIAPM